MSYNLLWIFLLISHDFVASLPVRHQYGSSGPVPDQQSTNNGFRLSNYDSTNQQVISVSVTSSVAVGRGKTKTNYRPHPTPPDISKSIPPVTPWNPHFTTQIPFSDVNSQQPTTYAPPRLLGANIEYLKQLNAKKDYDTDGEQLFQVKSRYTDNYETTNTDKNYEHHDYMKDLPQGRKVPSTSNVNMFHERNRFYHNAGPKHPTDTNRLFNQNYSSNMTATGFSFSNPAVGPLNNMHTGKNFTSLPSFTNTANFQEMTRVNKMDVNHFFSTEAYHARDSVAEASAKNLEYTKSNLNNGNIQASHSAHSLDYDQDINRVRNTHQLPAHNFNIPQTRKRPTLNVFQDRSGVYQDTSPQMSTKLYTHSNLVNLTSDPIFENSMLGSRMHGNNNKNTTNKPIYTQELDYGTVTNTNDMTNMYDFFTTETYQTDDSVPEASIKSVDYAETNVNVGNVLPTVPPPRAAHSPNYAQGLHNKRVNQEINHPRLTTVSFNVLHDSSTVNMNPTNNMGSSGSYMPPSQISTNHFSEPSKIYSQPSQIYSEPSKYYSEPAKVYSEPSKVYSEPSKVYGEPSKVYSEPSKFYSEPASLHLDHSVSLHRSTHAPQGSYSPWQQPQQPTGNTAINTTPLTTITNSYQTVSTQKEHQPEKNYEVDEKVSVLTDGRSHGVQESNAEKCKQDNCKVGYVVEGRQFKKYRVEERTSDGFIVGEYGVVRNEDGDLRGVRYTADSDASPGLIHDALMKFLQL